MTWAYAARLPDDGSLVWPGGDRYEATPPREYRLLPDLFPEANRVILRLCSSCTYDSRQLDWGAVAIRVNADGLRQVLNLIGPAGGPATSAYYAFADGMRPGDEIALVAVEL
jgi:hypothetical protein